MNLPGGTELIIVVLVLVLLFGSSKLPSLARSMGQAKKEFKAGIKEGAAEKEDTSEKEVTDCPSCGKKLDEGVKFCASCGHEIAAVPAPVA
jgi:sec-independent protein translocase protein TatA